MNDRDHEAEYNFIMPFVVTKTNDGPYEDDAFVAGTWFGKISAILEIGGTFTGYIPTALVPQIDLLVMHHGRTLTHEEWEDDPFHSFVQIA